ncbi:ribosome maturation factor RimP [Bartonella sp. F02]|uniref:ribosome maturation factor RimP n=1 Tax=Bartonella sp. F02 TaxID=2967262 RepID=UPI003FA49D22
MHETEKMDDIDEPRLFEEHGTELRIATLIIPLLKPLGFRLVRVKLLGLNGLTLQIMAERTDGTMTIEDCETVSRTVSPFLDVQNIIERKYHLEISSPGIDRPLVRKSDFFHWQGHIAKIETSTLIDGRQKFRGTLSNVKPEGFILSADKVAYGEEVHISIPFSDVTNAHLILTDKLIQDALKKNNTLDEQLTSEENFSVSKQEENYRN